jgi:hypothetical protein
MRKILFALLLLSAVPLFAQPFEVLPAFGRQGTEVFLRGVPGCPGPTCATKGVRFNGAEATMLRATNDGLVATVPALPEGLVDVAVVSPDGSLLTAAGAFRYTTHFDAANYARVLFPLIFNGPGAGGSQWVSENLASNRGPMAIDTIPALFRPQGIDLAMPSALPAHTTVDVPATGDAGLLLLVPHGLEQFVAYASHVRDISRAAQNLGAEIRVVREQNTAEQVVILGVPSDARYRPRLRIYDIDGREGPVTVRVSGGNGFTLLDASPTLRRSFVCVTTPCEDAAYATLDLQTALAALPAPATVEVTVTGEKGRRLWAFVSLTNNETQQVTTYSPAQ